MENTSKQESSEKGETKSTEMNASSTHTMGSASSMTPGSGIEYKLVDLEVCGVDAAIKPPVFNNRFTRMELDEGALIRTDKGFLQHFNLNSHLTLKGCWKDQSVKQDKGDLEKKD